MAQLLNNNSRHSGKNVVAFEFFSGIGGFHAALQRSCGGKVLKAFEISLKCTATYSKNFPDTEIIKKTIDSLKVDDLVFKEALPANSLFVWLLSPPCQPFTRSGKGRDDQDNRTKGFLHLIQNLLPVLCTSTDKRNAHKSESGKIQNIYRKPDIIFIENVVGFEKSRTRRKIMSVVVDMLNYTSNEYILDSVDFGIPNQRPRYYGVFTSDDFASDHNYQLPMRNKSDSMMYESIMDITSFNIPLGEPRQLSEFLDLNPVRVEISQAIMSKAMENKVRYDIALASDVTSACLSKGYGKFPRGYGALLLYKISNVANGEESMLDNPSRKASYSFNDVNIEYHLKLNVKQNSNDDQLETHGAANIIGNDQENGLKARNRDYFILWRHGMHLRYFTPSECLRLLHFPDKFEFPSEFSSTECLSLCGNSLNVKVVEEVLRKTFRDLNLVLSHDDQNKR